MSTDILFYQRTVSQRGFYFVILWCDLILCIHLTGAFIFPNVIKNSSIRFWFPWQLFARYTCTCIISLNSEAITCPYFWQLSYVICLPSWLKPNYKENSKEPFIHNLIHFTNIFKPYSVKGDTFSLVCYGWQIEVYHLRHWWGICILCKYNENHFKTLTLLGVLNCTLSYNIVHILIILNTLRPIISVCHTVKTTSNLTIVSKIIRIRLFVYSYLFIRLFVSRLFYAFVFFVSNR